MDKNRVAGKNIRISSGFKNKPMGSPKVHPIGKKISSHIYYLKTLNPGRWQLSIKPYNIAQHLGSSTLQTRTYPTSPYILQPYIRQPLIRRNVYAMGSTSTNALPHGYLFHTMPPSQTPDEQETSTEYSSITEDPSNWLQISLNVVVTHSTPCIV